jgi:hypothetical protein
LPLGGETALVVVGCRNFVLSTCLLFACVFVSSKVIVGSTAPALLTRTRVGAYMAHHPEWGTMAASFHLDGFV